MYKTERLSKVLGFINKKRIVATQDLVSEFNVSIATAYRDIDFLAKNRQIEKMLGGARAINPEEKGNEPTFAAKKLVNQAEKQRIAVAAKKYIEPGDKIMLDSGTTVLELARLLNNDDHVTVVTNDIRIASELTNHPEITLLLIGGMVRKGYCSSYGFFAEEMMKDITFDKIFLSVDAIDSDFGIMSYTMDDVNIKKIGMKNSKMTILLCDHSKFTTRALFSIDSLEDVDVIIVGEELDPVISKRLQQLGKYVESV